MKEKVAVLLASYNGEKYIVQQLDSLLKQTYSNFICYIHDDGSNDNTKIVINEFAQKYPNKFVVLDGEKTGGAKENFFYLLKSVEADYYFFADQDDYWKSNKMEEMLVLIKEKEKNNKKLPYYVFCDLEIVDKNLDLIASSYIKYTGRDNLNFNPLYVIHRNYAPGCASLINKSLRDLMIKVSVDNIVMHDWWGLIVAATFGQVIYYPKSLVKYRQHENNELGAQKYYSVNKLKKLKCKKEEIKRNIKQAEEFCKNLKAIKGNFNKEITMIDEYLQLQSKAKLIRMLYNLKSRKNYTTLSWIWFILFA